jgi:hypothetical protein
MMTTSDSRYDDLAALYVNCTLKPSPQLSHTQGLIDASAAIMRKQGVRVAAVRAVDHNIATGVWPDMTEHGAASDAWPRLYEKVLAADILVIAGPIWLGDNSSVAKRVIERLYACSHLLNDAGQYAYYGRVGGCLVTGNEDGVKQRRRRQALRDEQPAQRRPAATRRTRGPLPGPRKGHANGSARRPDCQPAAGAGGEAGRASRLTRSPRPRVMAGPAEHAVVHDGYWADPTGEPARYNRRGGGRTEGRDRWRRRRSDLSFGMIQKNFHRTDGGLRHRRNNSPGRRAGSLFGEDSGPRSPNGRG